MDGRSMGRIEPKIQVTVADPNEIERPPEVWDPNDMDEREAPDPEGWTGEDGRPFWKADE